MRLIIGSVLILFASTAEATRIKELASFEGVRANHLTGYGLVVGLNGQGDNDSARFTVKSLAALMQRQGINVSEREIRVKNVAAVMVTAKLAPFARPGQRVDVQVSSTGNAKSLQGGTLLLTRLKGADGKVYALAQGPLTVGGFSLSGNSGSGASKNHPTVGAVPGGGMIERAAPSTLSGKEPLRIQLHRADFTTAARMARTINERLGSPVAKALDPSSVQVTYPERFVASPVELIAGIENLQVRTDTVARVIVNERTGTIVMGENVRIETVAISHGNLVLQVDADESISQPEPLSAGTTAKQKNEKVTVTEESTGLAVVERGATLGRVVTALNALGVSTRDLIAILQAMRSSGALRAELEVL